MCTFLRVPIVSIGKFLEFKENGNSNEQNVIINLICNAQEKKLFDNKSLRTHPFHGNINMKMLHINRKTGFRFKSHKYDPSILQHILIGFNCILSSGNEYKSTIFHQTKQCKTTMIETETIVLNAVISRYAHTRTHQRSLTCNKQIEFILSIN